MVTRVLDGIKFYEQFLKRTSKGTFLPSLFQIGPVVLEEKLYKEIVDDARRTHHHPRSSPWARCAHVSWTGVTKGLNSVKSFQNLRRSFRGEEFWSISISPYSAKSLTTPPPPPNLRPCLSTDQNFTNPFLKRVTQGTVLWNYSKFWSAFQRRRILKNFFKSIECKVFPPPPPAAMFFDGSKFHK